MASLTGNRRSILAHFCLLTAILFFNFNLNHVYAHSLSTDFSSRNIEARQTIGPVITTADSTIQPVPPAGLKYVSLVDPHSLNPGNPKQYPVLVLGKWTVWALSYIDNRDSFNILIYDQKFNLIKSFEAPGARYIWQIALTDGVVQFIGQVEEVAKVPLSDLEGLVVVGMADATLQPPSPVKSVYASLTDPNIEPTDPRFKPGDLHVYPVVVIGGQYTVWALSYKDNRGAFNILVYDTSMKLVKNFEAPGARYIWKIVLDNDRVLFAGQAGAVAVVKLADLLVA